jgi:hypothetical protein
MDIHNSFVYLNIINLQIHASFNVVLPDLPRADGRLWIYSFSSQTSLDINQIFLQFVQHFHFRLVVDF